MFQHMPYKRLNDSIINFCDIKFLRNHACRSQTLYFSFLFHKQPPTSRTHGTCVGCRRSAFAPACCGSSSTTARILSGSEHSARRVLVDKNKWTNFENWKDPRNKLFQEYWQPLTARRLSSEVSKIVSSTLGIKLLKSALPYKHERS